MPARAPGFEVKAPLSRFSWADMTFAEVQPPFRILERGRGGKFNRIRMLGTYTLSAGPGGPTKVEYTLETVPVMLSDRLMETFGGRVLEPAPGRQGDAPAATDPRGEPVPRAARLGRGTITTLPRRELPPLLDRRSASRRWPWDWRRAAGTRKSEEANANNNGGYVAAGPITYQLQVSRQLNPYATEDKQYLTGLPAGTPQPKPDEMWYGVFLQAKNQTDAAAKTTDSFDIVDTQGNKYYPLALNPADNPVRVAVDDARPVG